MNKSCYEKRLSKVQNRKYLSLISAGKLLILWAYNLLNSEFINAYCYCSLKKNTHLAKRFLLDER